MSVSNVITAYPREVIGKANRKLAGQNRIPAVVYGIGREAISISVDRHDFELLMAHHAAGSTIVEMQIDSRFSDIPNDSGASILTSGVLGDRYIGLDPGGALDALTDGDEIFITQPAVVIETLISKYLFNSDQGDEQ